jgi:molybdenum cofactor biosynthesis enzyme MoaA
MSWSIAYFLRLHRLMSHNGFGSKRITVELTNICNLHCSYCLRDEDALYHTPANFLSPDLLQKIIVEARDAVGVTTVVFTGGEPTLHPAFKRIIEVSEAEAMKVSFVTNGGTSKRYGPPSWLTGMRSHVWGLAWMV